MNSNTLQLVLISGLSGSGKSISLNVLEDGGYYCVDNLPATMLGAFITFLRTAGYTQAAVAIDMRSGNSLSALPDQIRLLRADTALDLQIIFLQASDERLVQRFSETRRRHPLADGNTTLVEAIVREREELLPLSAIGQVIDTSQLKPQALRTIIKETVQMNATQGFTLVFVSFGFKFGRPLDADLIFDLRCLPNPYYDTSLQLLSGKDAPVINFLTTQPVVLRMLADVTTFIENWLPVYVAEPRASLIVALGCTGGRHRSVYFAEQLALHFAKKARVLVRHISLLQTP